MKFNRTLIQNIENIIEFTSDADDRKKAEKILERSKRPNTKLTDEDLVDFISEINHQSIHIPYEN